MTAREHNRERLRLLIQSQYQLRAALTADQLTTHCRRIVRNAEAGYLSHDDSLILGAFATSTVRECI